MDILNRFIVKIIIPITLRIPPLKRWMDKKVEAYENTNPDAIKTTDIASFYGLPNKVAKYLCDMACKQNLYSKNEDGTYKYIGKD